MASASQTIAPEFAEMDGQYIWCRYRRPLVNLAVGAGVDANRRNYHYYFKGHRNLTGNSGWG